MLDMFMSRARFHQMIWTTPRAVLLAKLALREPEFLDLCAGSRISAPPGPAWVKPRTSTQHYRSRLPMRELGENAFVFFTGDFTRQEQGAFLDEMLSEPLEDIEAMVARFRKRLAAINDHDDPFRLHASLTGLIAVTPPAANDNAVEERRSEQRRLNLLNEIFLYVEALGGYCRFGGLDGRPHAVRIGHMNVFFTLDKLNATRLRLEIDARDAAANIRLRWDDSDGTALENCLPELMVGLGLAAEAMCRRERASWNSASPVQPGDRSPLAGIGSG